MRKMILLSAIPGSGKSTWAAKYQKANPNTYIVSSDEIRQELFGKAQDFRNEALVWQTYLERINGYATENEDVTVIADATNLQNKYRIMYHDLTPGFDRHELVVFELPYEVCLRQNKMRCSERIVPDYAMEKLRAEWEEVSEEVENLYDQVIFIRNFSPNA